MLPAPVAGKQEYHVVPRRSADSPLFLSTVKLVEIPATVDVAASEHIGPPMVYSVRSVLLRQPLRFQRDQPRRIHADAHVHARATFEGGRDHRIVVRQA